MAVSYKKLWHILVDRDMKKKDLEALAGLSHYTMSKMSRDENVTTEVLGKVCAALDCNRVFPSPLQNLLVHHCP